MLIIVLEDKGSLSNRKPSAQSDLKLSLKKLQNFFVWKFSNLPMTAALVTCRSMGNGQCIHVPTTHKCEDIMMKPLYFSMLPLYCMHIHIIIVTSAGML